MLYLESSNKKKLSVFAAKDCGLVTNLNLAAVESEASVAPFGDLHDMNTKVDPNVRVALEIDASR
jgi:hypothetical protein